VLFSAIGSIGERLDSKFITAYFFPAFVAVLGTIWILATAFGGRRLAAEVLEFDPAEQAIVVAVVLLATLMLAHMLRALSRPVMQFYAGRTLPRPASDWSTRGQLKARARIAPGLEGGSYLRYPRETTDTEPTSFGNILAAAKDYPRLVYAMEGTHWWPRLLPLLPAEFQEMLHSMHAPMMGMLNLSLVFSYLAFLGVIALGLATSNALAALVILVMGIVLGQLSYRAGVTQAVELVRHIGVAFDLYRYEILKQLHLEEPADIEEEREVWRQLADRLHVLDAPTMAARIESEAPAAVAKDRTRTKASEGS
jgi:hypothetical protein